MELTESSKKNLLLGIVGESKTLNNLGGSDGSLNILDGIVGSSGLVLGNSVGLVVLLVANSELVASSEGLAGLGWESVDGETVLVVGGRGVVEAGEVHWVGVHGLVSGSHALVLSLESSTWL